MEAVARLKTCVEWCQLVSFLLSPWLECVQNLSMAQVRWHFIGFLHILFAFFWHVDRLPSSNTSSLIGRDKGDSLEACDLANESLVMVVSSHCSYTL